ncbi:MAG: sugar phosphate isomerase/epimerase [Methanomicrobium sp.]|nr:sugar phosphate isomerase/epimerase [Methanomicrobium sp.]
MPKYSVSSMFFHEYKIAGLFSYVSESGCSSIEFWLETPDFWLNGLPVGKLQKVMARHPLLNPVTVHAPVLDLNPCSVNPEIAEVSIRSAEKAILIAEELNAQVITIHPGRRTAKRKPGKRDYERLDRYLERVKIAAEKKNVKVAIENMHPKINGLMTDPKSVEELLEKEKWLYFTLDISHAMHNFRNDGFDYIDLLFEKIVNVHVSGTNEKQMHTLPSTDEKTKELLIYLSDCGYNGHLTLELEDLNFSARQDKADKIKILSHETDFLKKIFES